MIEDDIARILGRLATEIPTAGKALDALLAQLRRAGLDPDGPDNPEPRHEGGLLRQVQAEVRSLRTEQGMLRRRLDDSNAALLDRIGDAESTLETRFDRLERRLEQSERSIAERLDRIERLLTAAPSGSGAQHG